MKRRDVTRKFCFLISFLLFKLSEDVVSLCVALFENRDLLRFFSSAVQIATENECSWNISAPHSGIAVSVFVFC